MVILKVKTLLFRLLSTLEHCQSWIWIHTKHQKMPGLDLFGRRSKMKYSSDSIHIHWPTITSRFRPWSQTHTQMPGAGSPKLSHCCAVFQSVPLYSCTGCPKTPNEDTKSGFSTHQNGRYSIYNQYNQIQIITHRRSSNTGRRSQVSVRLWTLPQVSPAILHHYVTKVDVVKS